MLNFQLMVNWWFGSRWFGNSRGTPKNPFHPFQGIPGIQTTTHPPNHYLKPGGFNPVAKIHPQKKSSPLRIGLGPKKGRDRLPTINFQRQIVRFREGTITIKHHHRHLYLWHQLPTETRSRGRLASQSDGDLVG